MSGYTGALWPAWVSLAGEAVLWGLNLGVILGLVFWLVLR
jgi:hypothetical protein